LSNVPASSGVPRLLNILKEKGVVSDADLAQMSSAAASTQPAVSASLVQAPAKTEGASAPQAKPPAPKFIPAVAPVRVLPIDPPKREGLIPDLKIGPVRVKPYGFYKTSAVYDSSSPRGDDFPLPQFLSADTGPDPAPEFHIKARALRVGSNFEWVDPSPNLTLTGRLELDFEGNFSRVDNRNISSIRSNAPTIRLGWVRLDYAASDTTTIFAEFGQDWTPFGSSTLPNIIETTGLGVGFGSLYERSPQIKGGFVHNFGGSRSFKISPEVAAVMPSYGNLPTDVGNQLGYGERQGADSARPEVEARLVAQFQLDKAPGVAPAQFIVSGVQGRRDAVVLAADVPAAFKSAFPRGVRTDSERYGVSGEVQLPTRYLTITGKAYRGADLRYFFATQLFSTFNDTLGLTGTAPAVPSVDGSSTVVFGRLGTTAVVAPQRPVRGNGGFVGLGLPLSRIAHADPAGRNAGWTLNLHWGIDQVAAQDAKRLTATAGARYRSDLFAANLQYKLNNWVTFAYEQSLYRTLALRSQNAGLFPLWQGVRSHEANDRRSEFATIFTF
ncbi:MAG TPA: hypothetical protein VEX69_06890, partial [Candidatus Limnocylindria bacterium]|nr:hypothetical protein [Candidatus Limnocylindria bacterium]